MKTTSDNIYRQAARFAKLTLRCIVQENTPRLVKYLGVADRLLATGSRPVKNAVANVFLVALSNFLETRYEQGRKIIRLFPEHLRAEYNKQVYASAS